jgi:hypothetical protein
MGLFGKLLIGVGMALVIIVGVAYLISCFLRGSQISGRVDPRAGSDR